MSAPDREPAVVVHSRRRCRDESPARELRHADVWLATRVLHMTAWTSPTPGHTLLRPLVLTADLDLLEDLLRLAAAAGVEPEVVADPGAALRSWDRADLVLVGNDQAGPVARLASSARLHATTQARRTPGAGVRSAGVTANRGEPPVVVVVSSSGQTGGDPSAGDIQGGLGPDADVWRHAVSLGAAHVVFLPQAEGWLIDLLASRADGRAEAPVVGVLGGRGGAGATSLAVALAITASRRGCRSVLIDADPLGGGIDLALGSEDCPGARWPDLAEASGRLRGVELTTALLEVPGLTGTTVLSWDRGDLLEVPEAAMRSVLDAACRASDLVVLDLPRHVDGAARWAVRRSSLVLLVVPADVRSVASSARVAASLAPDARDLRVVVRGPAPAGLAASHIAESLDLSLMVSMRAEPGLGAALDRGDPPARRRLGPLARAAAAILDTVDEQCRAG